MGERYFSHGLENNRVALQAFIDTSLSDGLIDRRIAVDELFGLQSPAT